MHPVAAIGDAHEVAQLSGDRHPCGWKADADGSITRGQVLADAAPAETGRHRSSAGFVSHFTAKAATCNFHLSLPVSGVAFMVLRHLQAARFKHNRALYHSLSIVPGLNLRAAFDYLASSCGTA